MTFRALSIRAILALAKGQGFGKPQGSALEKQVDLNQGYLHDPSIKSFLIIL